MLDGGAEKSDSVRSEQDFTALESWAYSVTLQSGVRLTGDTDAKAASGNANRMGVIVMAVILAERGAIEGQTSNEDNPILFFSTSKPRPVLFVHRTVDRATT